MRFLVLCIAAVVLAAVGCGTNTYTDTTPTKAYSNDLTKHPFGQSVQSHAKTVQSDYEACLQENRGMPGAEQYCTDWINARRPGQMPKYYWYGYGAIGMSACPRRVQTATGVYCY
ncbi:MAG: hypothetical protein RDU25_06015 [Patescibacteria group bacterium]|nr:hypothetical protein [Patescibacteria group bacterium]